MNSTNNTYLIHKCKKHLTENSPFHNKTIFKKEKVNKSENVI